MEDVQSSPDSRELSLEFVGITHLSLPLQFQGKDGTRQQLPTTITFLTNLKHAVKGTHMSRFLEILQESPVLSLSAMKQHVLLAQKRLESENVYLEIAFTHFKIKRSPITNITSYAGYKTTFICTIAEQKVSFRIMIQVPVMLLCPCSKAISKHNAHNQRSIVTLDIMTESEIDLDSLIALVEREASSELYPILKRLDEKYVTEQSYENPKFVEDIVRDVALQLARNKAILYFSVACESLESIHMHNAYARYMSEGYQPRIAYVSL